MRRVDGSVVSSRHNGCVVLVPFALFCFFIRRLVCRQPLTDDSGFERNRPRGRLGANQDIFGVGPPYVSELWLNANGGVGTSDSGMQILFDGQPAPLIYASRGQTNAIVPYEVANKSYTTAEVVYNGIPSAAWDVPVAAAAPAIFTDNGTGVGQAAVLNQDNSINSPANPALRGTVVQIFAPGAGADIAAGGDWQHNAIEFE
jgi:uncharacterized protein (TIGR03437 family)